MSAEEAQRVRDSLAAAVEARETLAQAKDDLRLKQIRYLRDAQRAGWDWKRIACSLGITVQAAHDYWKRHRLAAGRLGD